MKAIQLAHLYFDFSIKRWEQFQNSGISIEELFHKEIFTKRVLRRPFPLNIYEAKQRTEELRAHFDRSFSYIDSDYPIAFDKLGPTRPPVVYLKGSAIPEEKSLISIVGTRKPSAFGSTNAEAFSFHLSARGYGVVSGLALGIDGIVHRKTLPNYTIAILGAGFDSIYPREHSALADEIIAAGGTLLSQFPPEQVPLPINFPRRNALIAALSAGVIVIEGSEKSGANITGKLALELGSTVITLLQDFRNPGGRGAIQLLELGATPVRNIEEALHSISLRFGGETPSRGMQLSFPLQKEFHLAEYQEESALSLGAAIASLEAGILARSIERLPNGYYRRK